MAKSSQELFLGGYTIAIITAHTPGQWHMWQSSGNGEKNGYLPLVWGKYRTEFLSMNCIWLALTRKLIQKIPTGFCFSLGITGGADDTLVNLSL